MTRKKNRGGYHWLSKEERVRRNSFILEKKAEGWSLARIAAQTNLTVRGVEEVICVARRRMR